jgi:hypothetical protein
MGWPGLNVGTDAKPAAWHLHVQGNVGHGCEKQDEERDAGKEKFLRGFIFTSFDFHRLHPCS